jgi:hypothetical protein
MATGIEMMLRTFGLDPAEIKKNIEAYGRLVVELHGMQQETLKRVIDLQTQMERLNHARSSEPTDASATANAGTDPDRSGNGSQVIKT